MATRLENLYLNVHSASVRDSELCIYCVRLGCVCVSCVPPKDEREREKLQPPRCVVDAKYMWFSFLVSNSNNGQIKQLTFQYSLHRYSNACVFPELGRSELLSGSYHVYS